MIVVESQEEWNEGLLEDNFKKEEEEDLEVMYDQDLGEDEEVDQDQCVEEEKVQVIKNTRKTIKN